MKDVQSLLRQLGQGEDQAPAPASTSDGSGREARMAARMDAELAKLVRARRARRMLGSATLAAAAFVLLAWGMERARWGSPSVGIGREPLAPVARQGREREPAFAPPAASVPPSPSATAPPARGLTPSSITSSNAATPSASAAMESTLAEENRLFKAAAEASRQGDTSRALAELDQLLSDHPRSPLAQTALVRKFRLLVKSGSLEAARREAERYLLSYPTGFAVAEAEALARGGPSSASSAEPIAP